MSYDIVLWGATGFTGRLVAEYLVRHAPAGVTWAMAGRSRQKLEALRHYLSTVDPAAANLDLLLGDSFDRDSLAAMADQARVIISTVGPYARYGTPLVEVCAEKGVDYCDLTGEVQWVRANIDAFHDRAAESGARIVHCCGFDSIPSDLGAYMVDRYARENHGRGCHAITNYFTRFKGGASGGTIASMLTLMEQSREDRQVRRLLVDPYALVPERAGQEKDTDYVAPTYDEDVDRWIGPFLMAGVNARIVRRSAHLLDREFTYREVSSFGDGLRGRMRATTYSLGLGAGMGAMQVGPLRSLAQKRFLPAPGEGPSAQERAAGYFRNMLLGRVKTDAGEAWIRGQVGDDVDPGYASTSKMLAESALCLALDDLPERAGILTPAAAMGDALPARLRAAGMTFEVGPWEGE